MANDIRQPKKLPQKYRVLHAINGLFAGKTTEERVVPVGAELTIAQLGETNARTMLASGAVEAVED